MPVPIKLSNGMQDTTLLFNHSASGQVFHATLGFSPTELIFDPEMWLVSRNNIIQELLSTGEPVPEVSIDITPNPAFDAFTIHLKAADGEKVRLTLWAADGKLVQEASVDVIPGLNEIPVAANHLPAGRYLVRLETRRWKTERPVILN
jgi:hypothetical protein